LEATITNAGGGLGAAPLAQPVEARLSPAAPNSLFAITADDGGRFARTKERMCDHAGILWTIFGFDADGRATERRTNAFCGTD
jgi:hypothetical protein